MLSLISSIIKFFPLFLLDNWNKRWTQEALSTGPVISHFHCQKKELLVNFFVSDTSKRRILEQLCIFWCIVCGYNGHGVVLHGLEICRNVYTKKYYFNRVQTARFSEKLTPWWKCSGLRSPKNHVHRWSRVDRAFVSVGAMCRSSKACTWEARKSKRKGQADFMVHPDVGALHPAN